MDARTGQYAAFPDYPMDDEDVARMLSEALRIGDLELRSTRYPLKGTKIPGVLGTVTLDAALPAPLMEPWNLLAHFSSYSGVGIKTALGMGGTELLPPKMPNHENGGNPPFPDPENS